jgi:hypothetical protein
MYLWELPHNLGGGVMFERERRIAKDFIYYLHELGVVNPDECLRVIKRIDEVMEDE